MKLLETKILIVGAGLAGLKLAANLNDLGIDFHLAEGRGRLGGRIKSVQHRGEHFDVGPAWFWRGQNRIEALVRKYQLRVFEQFSSGQLSFEDERGSVQQVHAQSGMTGSMRLAGGMQSLVNGLARSLPDGRISLNTKLNKVELKSDGLAAELTGNDGDLAIRADIIVLALPPRIVAESVSFRPELPAQAAQAMESIPTWMAGQAKAVIIYDEPFWRRSGLSGTAMSRAGPMAEIHDASPESGESFALFGFIGVTPAHRQNDELLKSQIIDQLVRLYGEKAGTPTDLIIKDWAMDPFSATKLDRQPLYRHPVYGLPGSLQGLMNKRLVFGSTEIAPEYGGFLEGALAAADATTDYIRSAETFNLQSGELCI